MSALQDVFSELVRLETELWNAVEARLRSELEFSLASFEAVRLVAGIPGCRVNDIAEALAITIGGTSKLVDRVEAAGLVRRVPNPDDRRSSLLELTAAGKRMHGQASLVVDDELRLRLADPLTPTALQQLSSALTTLRSAGRNLHA